MSGEMEMVRTGRVWKFGDLINTDLIMPHTAFKLPKDQQHTLTFESIRPGWHKLVQPGDILIAGENFGMGSSRPVGHVMKACGISGVVAESLNGLCLRNCTNASLPAISCPEIGKMFEEGEIAHIDFLSGRIENKTRNTSMMGKPLPRLLAEIVVAGGVYPMLQKEGYIEPVMFTVAS